MALKLIEAKVDFGSVCDGLSSTKSLLFMYLSVNQLTYFIYVKNVLIHSQKDLQLLIDCWRSCQEFVAVSFETDFLD